ncbi:MAG: hypothetical protein ABI274_00240, partial [Ktedonobacterales bacterium]
SPPWDSATSAHPEIRVALIALQWTAVIAVLALALGGIPILLSAIKQLFIARRWGRLALFAVPPVAVAALVVVALLLAGPSTVRAQPSDPNGQLTPLAAILQLMLVAFACLVIVGSTVAVALGIRRSEVSERVTRLALIPAAIVTLGIVAGVVSGAILTYLIHAEASQLDSSPPIMPVLAVLMAVAAVIAVAALQRGIRAARQR